MALWAGERVWGKGDVYYCEQRQQDTGTTLVDAVYSALDATSFVRCSMCAGMQRDLTPEEHTALIPVLDDFLLALEYARNPPRGDIE